ncbi:MAG: hypothetical protein AB2989_05490 [Candidatus Symbiodolus clandestinus]
MFNRLFTSKNENQNIYADILENYAIVSSSEYSENNLILDIQTLTSLPINEQVNILNENFPGIHLEPPKQDWSVLNTVSAVMILPVLGYIIKRIIGFFGKKNSQSSSTNPPPSPVSEPVNQLSQSMAEASMGDQSTSRRRPTTRSMTSSPESQGLPNSGNDPLNN